MAGKIPNALRDQLITAFRERICEKMGVTPFTHQRQWWSAADGKELLAGVEDPQGATVQLASGEIQRWMTTERAQGRARVIADLGAFKVGKSFGAGLFAAAFAAVPGVQVSLVGLEYDTVSPEFNYIVEALFSEAGMGLKFDSLQNRPRDGKMWIDLPNGGKFDARSWERKETLKGKEVDLYLFCEAYQLPGIECYASIKQNLKARDGYAIFPTTPDRPWVGIFHEHGHNDPKYPEWECVCGIPRSVNRFTFSADDMEQDRGLLTAEKFKIAHLGQLGDFVGRVFNYQRGQRLFTPSTHPSLFRGGTGREHFRVPDGWEIVGGIDTGTFYTALLVAFSPEGDAFVIDEVPNYCYIAGAPQRDEGITIPGWAGRVKRATSEVGARNYFWADKNTQFRQELTNYGISVMGATSPVEQRTEITREYFEHSRIFLAPWLSVLPFELENAAWPEESSASGKFQRIKDRDHTLDCLEHVLARRPRGKRVELARPSTWLDRWARDNNAHKPIGNNHLGRHV